MSTMDPPKSEGEPEKPAITPAMASTPTAGSQHPPPSPLSGCYLLVVLPEPHNAQHKDLILNRIAKGFLSWDKDNCHVDLEKELQALVAQAPEGEEARNGERLIQYATENLVTEILIHPQSNTLLQCIRNLLASFTKHRHIIHAGYTFSENGSWILQDGTFSLADFLDAFNEHDVQRVLRAYENSVTVDINCAAIGEWSMQRLSKEPCTRSCRVRLNPDDVLTAGVPAITSFTNYISQYLVPQALDQLMQPSDVVGNIRFSHPTLYVFPGGQGDAALFGINGFNMLVDGGFARKSCFWDFTRHLDRLDAVLLTRMNNSNVGGMSSVLRKKREMQVYPQIGHFFCNLVERKHSNSPDGDKDIDPLILSLTELGQEMMLNLKHINLRPHPCYRDPEPINLYHKVGHGTLDMYVLSPSKDSREVREFLSKWNAGDWKLLAGSHKKDSNNLTFPIQNLVSICALLVWQPANPEDTITRILFPGSTPQHKIFEGIERLRHLEFLKHPRCTAKSISPSASLVALKDKPMKIQKSLIDRETKRAMEVRKAKREDETKQKIELTQPDKVEDKPKPIPKKREVVENKKIDSDVKENGMKDTKKIDKELKDVKEVKKIVKDDVKKTEMMKTKMETEKTASIKDTKSKPERKEKKVIKDTVQKIPLPKPKPEESTEKKTRAPAPKKIVNGASPKPEDKGKPAASKPAPKAAAKSLPAAAPKSAKDANNRKVLEQKNIERMSKAPAKPKSAPAPPAEKKAVPRRPKPAGSPSKAKFMGGSPIKSAKSTPTASVKSDKDGVIRKIRTEKGTADSSTVSTPSAIEIDSMNKFTDKCLTEKSEDMSLDSIESKVLADLKEERQVVEEIEAVLQKAERIEDARKESRIEGEDEVTGEATDKKDITEDMTEDDVTADIDEAPQKTPTRKASQEQLTEEEDEYLIIEKEEDDTQDSVHSGEAEHKHLLDAAQSEKEKILKDSEEYEEKEPADDEELEPEELEEEDASEEKEVAEEKGIVEEREKSDDAPEKKSETQKTPDNENIPLAEYKEQLKEEMKGIITSATEIVHRTEDKDDSGKKDSEDITKEPSSPSPEKLDSSEKKTTDTDVKPEGEKTKEKMEESQERISTIESGATTTAPTLPEDERISIDVVKPTTTEKTIEDQKVEAPEKPKEILPLATEPSEVKPEVRMFNVRQGPQALQRDIVKTPDEVADLPVHEEVDPKLYKMDDFEKSKDDKAQVPTTAAQDVKESPSKDQKGVFSFFGKVADKFERGMDKLTGKGRRDSENDVDEKSSSKSGSPKDEHRPDIAPAVVADIQPAKIEEKVAEKESVKPAEAMTSAPPPPKSPKAEEKIEQTPLDSLQKPTDTLDDLEDADEVEALLEESSKKFKTVKDSLHDSLESLEEKIVEEEFKRAAELVASTKDDVKDTLEEVVEKLEGIKPQIDEVAMHDKEPEKVHFEVPADDEDSGDEEGTDYVRDLKEAVREVGEVLAGTAGIILEEKPKDVIEIVKKVAEVLKEDDFLSEKVLFKKSTENLAAEEKIEEPVEKKSSPLLECKEEPWIKKTVGEPVISPIKEKTSDAADAKAICEDLMKDEPSVERRKRSVTEHEGRDVLEAGIEEVCRKVELPERQEKQGSPEVDHKEDRRDSMEIEPSQISLDHKIAPTTAEYVVVTPDSLPPSPKFPNEKIQSHIEKEMITSQLPRPGLPVEIENIIESAKTIDEIIEQLVFTKNKKITIEIIEYIILIKKVPREQIIHIIQEIIIKKKVPRESVVADANILQAEDETQADHAELGDASADTKGESPKEEDDLMTTDKQRAEVESEILQEYVRKNKRITRAIIEEIHVKRGVPIYVIIEIIEYMIIKKKFNKQSVVDIDDANWAQLKLEYTDEDEEEGKSVDEDQQPEDFIMVPSAEEIENIHIAESDVLDNYISKGKKITREIIETIHITRKVPIYVVIEIIEKIIITKKLQKHLTIDMPGSAWNDFKSEALKEEKRMTDKAHDGFEAVEQEYKFSEGKDQQQEALDDDISDVIEADEKLIDKTFTDKSRGSVTLGEKGIPEPEEKESPKDRKLSAAEIQKHEMDQGKEDADKDEDSSTVRRMIVTTTSEDGGDEIVICPTGSITFGKSTSPEDSLKGSPLKTEPDKDSLRSHGSTPEKDSLSGKDSLEKSPPSIPDSQTLEDSIEKSKPDEKKGQDAHPIEDKASKDLHLDEIHKQPSDFGKTEDASPAESIFAESPLKELPKSDVVDAKPIPDDKTLKQDPKDGAKVVPSPVQVPSFPEDTSKKEATSPKLSTAGVEEKDSIDVVLDKSKSSSIASLTQDEPTPAPILDISRKDSTVSQEPIVKADGGDIAHDQIGKPPITAPSSDDVDLTISKGSVADVEKDKDAMQGRPDQPSKPGDLKLDEKIDDKLTNVQSKIPSPKEKEKLKEEKVDVSDKTLDLKIKDTLSETKSPSPGPDVKQSITSPDIATVEKDSMIHEKEEVKGDGKIEKRDSIVATSPISKESPVSQGDEKLNETRDKLSEKEGIQSPSSPVISSRKESLIQEKEELDGGKSIETIDKIGSTGVPSPVRKESMTMAHEDDKTTEKHQSPTSPMDISPIKKESLSGEKDPSSDTAVVTTQLSPGKQVDDKTEAGESVDDKKSEEHRVGAQSDGKKSETPSPPDIKSSKSSREPSPIRKDNLLIESKDIKADGTSDGKKSPASSVGDVKSGKSSRTASPDRKESLTVESHVKTEMSDKKSPASSVGDVKSGKSSRAASPDRKESLIAESHIRTDTSDKKSPASSVGDVKSGKSSRAASPDRKESLIAESHVKTDTSDKKSPASSIGDASPIRKESLIAESHAKTDTSDKKSPASSIGDVKSAKSSRDASADRKESLIAESHVKTEMSDKKSPASSVGDVKSAKSSRDTSPVRKESILTESDVKSEISDKKSPTPSVTDAKSPLPSRDISPLRKESLTIEKLGEENVIEKAGTISPIAVAASPTRKESISHDEKEKSPESTEKKDEKIPSPVGSISPIRKESLIADEKELPSAPRKLSIGDEHSEGPIDSQKPPKSPSAVSPIRKESITSHEKIAPGKVDSGIDKGSPSPAESVKSPASPRDISPVRKTSIALEEKVSASPRLSIDIKSEEKSGDAKSPSPLAASIKSSTSPGETSPIRKESLVSDKMPTGGDVGTDQKTPSPAAERKPSISHQDTSSIRKESLVLDEKISTPRASIDMKSDALSGKSASPTDVTSTGDATSVSDGKIAMSGSPKQSIDSKPEDVGSDKKSSSPFGDDTEFLMSPRESSPTRKLSAALSELMSTGPRGSIGTQHDIFQHDSFPHGALLDNEACIQSALRETLSSGATHSLIAETVSGISTVTKEPEPEKDREKASSPDEKVSISGTPRASIDIKPGEQTTDKESPSDKKESSPDEKVSISGTPRASVDITLEGGIADKKKSSPDDKVSVTGTPRASIDINLADGTIDKKTPSPDGKVSASGTPRASIDITAEKGPADRKESILDEKVSISGSPRASIDMKLGEVTIDKKTPSPASVSPSPLSPARKDSVSEKSDDKKDEKSPASAETREASIIGDEKQVIETSLSTKQPDDSMDIKLHGKESPAASVVDPKSAASSRDISPVRKESPAQAPHQSEEKKIDVKSSASSRDSSPVRKDSLVPGMKEKSPEPQSVTPQKLPTPEEKPEVKSSEPQGIPPARKESSTFDAKDTSAEASISPQAGQKLDDKVDMKSSSSQETLPARKESLTHGKEEKSLELSGLISHVPEKPEDKVTDTKSPPPHGTSVPAASPAHTISEKSPEPAVLPSQPKSDDSIVKDTIEKDLGTRSRSSSMASEKSAIVTAKDDKTAKPDTLHQLESSLHVEKSKSPSSTDSSPQKLTSAVGKHEDVEFPEVPSRDRSRSHSLFDTGEKTPLGRSRAASLFEEKEDIVKAASRKSSGLSEFHEEHFQREEGDEDYQVSEAKRIDIERYIMSQYVTRKRKIIGSTLEEIVALYDVPAYIVIETIFQICEKMKIPRESIIDDVSILEKTTTKSSAIKEEDDGDLHQFETYKGGSVTQYKEEHMSGKSSPERRSSGYSTPEVRHYDDKYESQFHKAFVGGMTEIRTTHITTLSGKSTPDVGTRIDTPDSLAETATSSDKIVEESVEGAPTIIKRTIITEVPEYETIVKKTIVKREILEEDDDDDGSADGKSLTTTKFDDKGVMKVDLNKSLMSLSSGRSTPDRIRDSSEGRSSTATPDSLRSHEVIRTTITKTRTMSDEGEIVTTTKEVTETTNERGETTVVEEKVDVKTTQVEPGMEISAHHWPEHRHHEDSEEDSPLSATSQVYHEDKGDHKHVEFSTADMSSSFYGKLPDIPQPRHSTEPVGDDKDFSFKKFSLEKHFAEGVDEHMSTSRQFADVADYDVDKVLRGHEDEHHGDDEDEDKDPIGGWGTPLKLPSPERPDKFNLRSTPIVRSSVDMSPDSLNFDVINDWGEPLRLPSPAPTADEASNKTMPPTPKKERRQPKKIVAENIKNKKRSDSPANKDKKKDTKKVQPVYLDLTYVPHHGNSYYASLDFFKRIRARYYVFSGTEPSREVYDALLDAKKTWENKNLEVTMIPTYDTDTLGYWVADNEEALAANHIDLSPSASRCTINLQDHETSCSAYRLEF